MKDHEFAQHLVHVSALLGLFTASVFAFAVVTVETTSLAQALGMPQLASTAAGILSQSMDVPMGEDGMHGSSTRPMPGQQNGGMPPYGRDSDSMRNASSTKSEHERHPAMHCPVIALTLVLGSHDATSTGSVHQLQEFLSSYFGTSTDNVTGYFGSTTQALVNKFQSQQGLTSVGSAGPRTRQAIMRLCAGNASSTPPMTSPPVRSMGSSTPPLPPPHSSSTPPGTSTQQ